MMSYKIMLHMETKTESFANNNTISTYNVFIPFWVMKRVSD